MLTWKINSKKLSTPSRKSALAIMLVLVSFVVLGIICAPEYAYAQGDGVIKGGLSSIIQMLNMLVTVLFLPLGILIASAKMIYIAVVGGMFGMDPLGIMGKQGQSVSGSDVSIALKSHLFGFAKGLAWVAGLFIVFKVALSFATILAGQVEKTFGTSSSSPPPVVSVYSDTEVSDTSDISV